MSPSLPDGDPAPDDGRLPPSAVPGAAARDFGVYVHVPFCTVRCGYCDFNTYTVEDLGEGASRRTYADTALREVELAARVLADAGLPRRVASTVFFGGGTPTILPSADLVRLLDEIRATWGLAPGAEVTTEANPDSVTPESLAALADGGFTRVSFGMQSAVPHVLATLDRTHDPDRVPQAVQWAREAGMEVSLDLIYGTPGESVADWRRSVQAALDCGVDHISAYALVIEPGTRMAVDVRRGRLPVPDEDDQATKYELADELFTAAGLRWYEISNWARTPEHASRHNLGYWRGADWWGIGPGAHSAVGAATAGGVRWWNVKHPRAYADRLTAGLSPAAGREVLDEDAATLERVMLRIRLAEGMPVADLPSAARADVAGLIADGLVEGGPALRGRLRLTLRGRLLADAVVRTLTR